MRKSLFVSIGWLVCLLGMASAAQVQQPRIIDLDGKGVPDVEIVMTSTCLLSGLGGIVSGGSTVKTDAQGYFLWDTTPPRFIAECQTSSSFEYKVTKNGLVFNRTSFGYGQASVIPTPRKGYDNRLPLIYAMPSNTPSWAAASSANYAQLPLTNDMIVAGFGATLATETVSSTTLPLATTLGNRRVLVRDGSGTERPAKLIFVSPSQINFILPGGMPNGAVAIRVVDTNNALIRACLSEVGRLALGIFAADANGRGVAASQIVRVKPGNIQTYEPVAQYDTTARRFVALPIDFGPADNEIFLVLYGTGFRQVAALSDVTVTLGGTAGTVTYAGLQPSLDGLDQINVKLPRTLIGRGDVDVVVKIGDLTSNTVTVRIK